MPRVGQLTFAALLVALSCAATSVSAQTRVAPGEQCTVQILNRTVRVDPEGNWRLSNIPVMGNRIRARLVCDDGVTIRRGEGPLMQLRENGTYALAPIPFGPANPAPTDLSLSGVPGVLTAEDPVQLTVIGAFPSGPADVTSSEAGTDYFSSSESVLLVTPEGLVTPLQSGNALITVVNQGITAGHQVRVELGDDSDGDGLPDDWETAHGLDPSDATDAAVDGDADNLTNMAEYLCGTDPFAQDSDGDSLNDGAEVIGFEGEDCLFLSDPRLRDSDGDLIPDQIELMTGTNPTNAESYDLDAALLSIEIAPQSLAIPFGTVLGDSLAQVTLNALLLDGSGVDLTAHPDVVWFSLNPQVADATVNPGEIVANGAGDTLIRAGVGAHVAQMAVSVFAFSPAAVGRVNVSGEAYNVDLSGGLAYAATTHGLAITSASVSAVPELLSELALNAVQYDVKVRGTYAYLAGTTGLTIVDVTDVFTPTLVTLLPLGSAVDLDLLGDDKLVVGAEDQLIVVDVSDPASPETLSSLTFNNTVGGIAVDGDIGIASLKGRVVGLSFEDPSAPLFSEYIDIGGWNGDGLWPGSRGGDVDLSDGLAAVAHGNLGLSTVDMSDPLAPLYLTTMGNSDFMLSDVVLDGDLVLGADYLRVNAVPLVSVAEPESPVFTTLIDFSSFTDSNGFGIDAQQGIVALAAGPVYIGLYEVPVDNAGVAPAAVLTQPKDGDVIIVGDAIAITVQATDDVGVSRVEFFADGVLLGTRSQAPYQFNLAGMPVGSVLTLHAEAYDLADNRGVSQQVSVAVIPDPLTTVTGRVLAPDGAPAEGALVKHADHDSSVLTGADGRYELHDIPTVKKVSIAAEKSLIGLCVDGVCGEVFNACVDAEPCEAMHGGIAGPQAAVRGGVTEMEDIVLTKTLTPVVMAGVVARPWTFKAFDSPNDNQPVSTMGGVVARPWTFMAFDSANEGDAIDQMTGVVARPWTFMAFDSANEGDAIDQMTGVVARPWTFESEDPP